MKKTSYFLTIFFVLFAILICWRPSLGPIDDRILFLPFSILRCFGNGRFYILDGIEQFGMRGLFGLAPFPLYLVNAIEFLLLSATLVSIIKKFKVTPKMTLALGIFAALSPGLCTAYFRLFAPERLLVLCFSALLLLDLDGAKTTCKKWAYFAIAFISFFLKEPAFLVVAGLSFFNLLKKKERSFNSFLLVLCGSYGVFLYYITRIIAPAEHYYGSTVAQTSYFGLLKTFSNFAFNDPLIALYCLPLWAIKLIRNKTLDPYSSIVTGYFSIFMILGFYQEYYLLPMLPFAIYVFLQNRDHTPKLIQVALLILTVNASLAGLSQLSNYKNDPRGFTEVIRALRDQNIQATDKICYLGADPEASREILGSTSLFLMRELETTNVAKTYSSRSLSSLSECHFVIDSPYNFDRSQVGGEWKAVHHYEPSFSIPNLSLRNFIKYWTLRHDPSRVVDKNLFKNSQFTIYVPRK